MKSIDRGAGKHQGKKQFDLALSFASENRELVESVATELRSRGIGVFYDKFEQIEMWGKDLYEHLEEVYHTSCRYCVMFVSAAYLEKKWTKHERRVIQSRLIEEDKFLLPVILEACELPARLSRIGPCFTKLEWK